MVRNECEIVNGVVGRPVVNFTRVRKIDHHRRVLFTD